MNELNTLRCETCNYGHRLNLVSKRDPDAHVFKCDKQNGKWMPSTEDGSTIAIVGCASHSNAPKERDLGDWGTLEEWIEHHAPWIQGTDDRVVDARELVRVVRQCKQSPPEPYIKQVRTDECERVTKAIDKELTSRVDQCNKKAVDLSSYSATWAGLKHEAIALSSMRDYIRESIQKQENGVCE
jgi:hypothetical protein